MTDTPDGADSLDQLQPEDTLVDRGVDDVLDEGYTAPERWSPAQGFGNTPEEQRQGETIDQRVRQEEPDVADDQPGRSWNADGEDRQVGGERAGRLVAPDAGSGVDREATAIGRSVGIDGGAASAEEAAMHVIDESDDDANG